MAAALQTQEPDQSRRPLDRLIRQVSDRAERFFLPEQHTEKLIAKSLEERPGEEFGARVTRIAQERDELMTLVVTRREPGVVKHYHALNHALDRIGAEVELNEDQARELLLARRGLEEGDPGLAEIDRRLERHGEYTWAAHGHDFAYVYEQSHELEQKAWDQEWLDMTPGEKLERVERLNNLEAQYLRNEIHDYSFDEIDARAKDYKGEEMLAQDRAWASSLSAEVYEQRVDALLDRRAELVQEGPKPDPGHGNNAEALEWAEERFEKAIRVIDHELDALRSIAPSWREAFTLKEVQAELSALQAPTPAQTARMTEIGEDLRRHEAIAKAPFNGGKTHYALPGTHGFQPFRLEFTPPERKAPSPELTKAVKAPSIDGPSM